jgi:broad specificity phosphatase PhoE
MALITLIRHGESVWNGEQRIQGNQDPPLSERGRLQAELLVRHLPAYVPRRAAAVYSSPLCRARETAELLAAALGLPLRIDLDLREIRLGDWEGRTVDEIRAAFPGRYERWREDPAAHPAPGSERLEAFAGRTAGALARLAAAHPGAPLILVAHGGTIRSLLCQTLGMDIRFLFRLQQDNTAVSQIKIKGDVRRVLHLNDTGHLTAAGDAVAPRDVITDPPEAESPTV